MAKDRGTVRSGTVILSGAARERITHSVGLEKRQEAPRSHASIC